MINQTKAEEPVSLDRIIIQKTAQDVYISSINSLGEEELKKLPLTSYLEALNYLAGLDYQPRGVNGVQADLGIRGGNFQQNLVMLNGVRLNDPQTAHFNLNIPLTIFDIDSVEAGGFSRYNQTAQDAISGAVNFSLKKASKNQLILQALGGSGRLRGGAFSLEQKKHNAGLRVSYERKKSQGFQYGTDFDIENITSNFNLDFSGNEFNLFLGMQNKDFGAYDFYTPARGFDSWEETLSRLVIAEALVNTAGIQLRPKIHYRRHKDEFVLLRNSPEIYTNHHRSDKYGFSLEADLPLNDSWAMALGISINREKIDSTNLEEHDYSKKSFNLDNHVELNENLSLHLGTKAELLTKFDDEFLPFLNLRYDFDNTQDIYFAFSKAYRLPTFTELYYSDSTTAGNENLDQENSYNFELGFNKSFDKFQTGSKIFYRRQRNTIEWTKQNEDDALWMARNLSDIDVSGLELYLKAEPKDNIDLRFNYTYLDWRLEDAKGYLPKYGTVWLKHSFTLGADFLLPFGTQTIECVYKKRAGRNNWFLTNIMLNYDLDSNSTIFLKISNIFNVGYEEFAGVPSPGRWIESGVSMKF